MKNPIAVHVGSGFQPAAGLLPGVATIAVVLGIIAFAPAALAQGRGGGRGGGNATGRGAVQEAPEEGKSVMYMAEHRIQDEAVPNESVRATCMYCHAVGRALQWRRTRVEWSLLADLHSALYQQADAAFRRNGAGPIGDGAGAGGAGDAAAAQ